MEETPVAKNPKVVALMEQLGRLSADRFVLLADNVALTDEDAKALAGAMIMEWAVNLAAEVDPALVPDLVVIATRAYSARLAEWAGGGGAQGTNPPSSDRAN